MAKGLSGKRIVIGASRKTDEMSLLIEKQGGIPIVRSLQGTVFLAEKEVEPELQKLIKEGTDWFILTTGIGTETLLNLSEKLGVQEQFRAILQQAKIAARGYKTFAALKKLGLEPVAVDDDGTTRGLMKALEPVDFTGKKVAVQLHGEKAPALINFLKEKEADVQLILPYQHIPAEPETLATLCGEIFEGKVDAVCFTTAIQVRSLFDYARETGQLASLVDFFQSNMLAVAVGKVTAEALREEGIERIVMPENERMGAMVVELSQYYLEN